MIIVNKVPRIGVGVIIYKDGAILLGRRKNAYGAGDWAPAGGHLEFGESPQECAIRETLEETGLIISTVITGPYTNDYFNEEKHYITLWMLSRYEQGEVEVKEPDKCYEWCWFDSVHLPSPLFATLNNLFKNYPTILHDTFGA